MISDKKLEEWGYTLDKHSHYGPVVQAAIRYFQKRFATYQALKKSDKTAAREMAIESQKAWAFVQKHRKEETGTGFYLNPEQYKEVTREFNR